VTVVCQGTEGHIHNAPAGDKITDTQTITETACSICEQHVPDAKSMEQHNWQRYLCWPKAFIHMQSSCNDKNRFAPKVNQEQFAAMSCDAPTREHRKVGKGNAESDCFLECSSDSRTSDDSKCGNHWYIALNTLDASVEQIGIVG
jgi:hypothetical protein